MDLSATLKEGIATWLNASPRRNLRLLERFTGVSYSTLRRLQAGERTPTPESIIPLCEVIFDREQTTKVLATHYPKMLSFFENVILQGDAYQNREDGSAPRIGKENFIIFAFCSSGKRVSKEEVQNLWGRHGLALLQELIDSDVLQEEDGLVFNKSENIVFTSRKDPIDHVGALLSLHSEIVRTEHQKTLYDVAAVSPEILAQLEEARNDFAARQTEILKNNDENSGTQVYYCATFSGIMNGE